MDVSNVVVLSHMEKIPLWAHIVFAIAAFIALVVVVTMIYINSADDTTRAKFGIGPKGKTE